MRLSALFADDLSRIEDRAVLIPRRVACRESQRRQLRMSCSLLGECA